MDFGSVEVIRIDQLWLCTAPVDMRAGAERIHTACSPARSTTTPLPARPLFGSVRLYRVSGNLVDLRSSPARHVCEGAPGRPSTHQQTPAGSSCTSPAEFHPCAPSRARKGAIRKPQILRFAKSKDFWLPKRRPQIFRFGKSKDFWLPISASIH